MRRDVIGIGVALLLAAAGGSWWWFMGREPAYEVEARTFRTKGCRAETPVAARPHPGGEHAYTAWAPPEAAPLRLVEIEGEVSGESPDEVGIAHRWTHEDVAGWATEATEDVLQLTSPVLDPPIDGATRVRVVLRPGGVRRLAVIPSPKDELDHRQRALRAVDFTLDASVDPEAPLIVTGSIADALGQNWGDDGLDDVALRRLGVDLQLDGADTAVIDEIVLEGAESAYAGAAAGTRTADIDGALHPAWFVHGGAAVRLPVSVPAGEPELTWYAAAIGGAVASIVVHARGEPVEVATVLGGAAWERQSLDLSPWAGTDIQLELGAAGSGVALFGAPEIAVPATAPKTPNVVVYLIDTLRADHLGAFGSTVPGVSPHIDRLAEEGSTFGMAISTSPWTKPAIPTLMSGLFPTTHQVGSIAYTDRMPPTVPLMQERFRDAGWRTGSFSASPLGSTLSALERGFDTALPPHFWRGRLGPLNHVSATQLHDAMLDWVDEDPERPFFAYVQTLEVHGWRRGPYKDPPKGYKRYDYAVQDADTQLGALLAALDERGLADDTLVVVTSDHGESFGDHGVKGHGTSIYQSQVHIPLLMWAGDALPPITVTDPVSLADVAPTVLDLARLDPLPEGDGRSLVPYLAGPTEPVHEWVPTARLRYIWAAGAPKLHGVVTADHDELIRTGTRSEQVFDLSTDPCEKQSLPRVARPLRTALDGWLTEEAEERAVFAGAHPDVAGEVDASDVELLKAMGYLH